jgi:hydroxymethylbilane synthase
MGAYARVEQGELVMDACVCSIDGVHCVKQHATAAPDQAAQLGEHMARLLLEAGAQPILEQVARQRA